MTRASRLVRNKGFLNKIIESESRSIIDNSEHAYMACNDGKMKLLGSENKQDSVEVDISDELSDEFCGKKGSTLFHTHANASGLPSSTDVLVNKDIFKTFSQVKSSCSVGIDGIFCMDRSGKSLSKLFNKKDQDKIIQKGNLTKWTGDSIFCDKISKEPNEKFLCISQPEKNKNDQTIMGVFDEVSMVGGVSEVGLKDSDVAMFSSNDNKSIECFGTTSGKKRIACINKH